MDELLSPLNDGKRRYAAVYSNLVQSQRILSSGLAEEVIERG